MYPVPSSRLGNVLDSSTLPPSLVAACNRVSPHTAQRPMLGLGRSHTCPGRRHQQSCVRRISTDDPSLHGSRIPPGRLLVGIIRTSVGVPYLHRRRHDTFAHGKSLSLIQQIVKMDKWMSRHNFINAPQSLVRRGSARQPGEFGHLHRALRATRACVGVRLGLPKGWARRREHVHIIVFLPKDPPFVWHLFHDGG